jgi:hypothetical protein
MSHEIATEAAKAFVKECEKANISWTEVMVACESFIAIVVLYASIQAGSRNPARWSQEMIELMLDRVHIRVQEQLRSDNQ